VVLAAALGAFVMLDLVFADRLTPARAAVMLEKNSPQLVSVLKAKFAADFTRIVTATVEAKQELDGGMPLSGLLDRQTRPIAERLDDEARSAPPELVAEWMNRLADAWNAVESVAGPQLCARFVNEGPSVLSDPVMLEALEPAFDARDAALFAALAGARDTPTAMPVGEATVEDGLAIDAAMSGLEVPAGYAQIIRTDDTESRDYCAALAYFYRTVADLPGESGQRIRAEYFVQSLS